MVLYVAADVALAKQIVPYFSLTFLAGRRLGETTVASINRANERGPRLSRFYRFCRAGLSFLWINAVVSCLQFYIHIIGIT